MSHAVRQRPPSPSYIGYFANFKHSLTSPAPPCLIYTCSICLFWHCLSVYLVVIRISMNFIRITVGDLRSVVWLFKVSFIFSEFVSSLWLKMERIFLLSTLEICKQNLQKSLKVYLLTKATLQESWRDLASFCSWPSEFWWSKAQTALFKVSPNFYLVPIKISVRLTSELAAYLRLNFWAQT